MLLLAQQGPVLQPVRPSGRPHRPSPSIRSLCGGADRRDRSQRSVSYDGNATSSFIVDNANQAVVKSLVNVVDLNVNSPVCGSTTSYLARHWYSRTNAAVTRAIRCTDPWRYTDPWRCLAGRSACGRFATDSLRRAWRELRDRRQQADS